MKRRSGAIAIDLGASSARFAAGYVEDGKIHFNVIEQNPHYPKTVGGRETWDLDALLEVCKRAIQYASQNFETATIGIDTWGVDSGFIAADGDLLQPVVCYRDLSHQAQFEALKQHRKRLFQLTGIQHQPFNTVYQLAARVNEDPNLPKKVSRWLLLPSLLGYLLGVETTNEQTMASTTQMMGLDGKWCEEAFEICAFPMPEEEMQRPGRILGAVETGVYLASIGSHDTASAVCGLGTLSDDTAFLNVGTWSLLGCVVDEPIVSTEAEDAGFSNERAVDGRVRFLTNVAGFYVINRLHQELAVPALVPEWLLQAAEGCETVDLTDRRFFNPDSMTTAIAKTLTKQPRDLSEWAGVALWSLVQTNVRQLRRLERITGRAFSVIRVAGGGSMSEAFCKALARESGKKVIAGPAEATVLGNLGAQFVATLEVRDFDELGALIQRSIHLREF